MISGNRIRSWVCESTFPPNWPFSFLPMIPCYYYHHASCPLLRRRVRGEWRNGEKKKTFFFFKGKHTEVGPLFQFQFPSYFHSITFLGPHLQFFVSLLPYYVHVHTYNYVSASKSKAVAGKLKMVSRGLIAHTHTHAGVGVQVWSLSMYVLITLQLTSIICTYKKRNWSVWN
jgi:hypothetical protein